MSQHESYYTQDRLTGRLAGLYEEGKGLHDTLRLALVAVGRGGQGDVGQRIRDEILTVQSNNGAKVGRAASPSLNTNSRSLTATSWDNDAVLTEVEHM